MDIHSHRILILDFGSQYTQLIARRVREDLVYCEILPFSCGLDFIRFFRPRGIILSGGPSSVYDRESPALPEGFFDLGIPTLGICYGMQLTSKLLGGGVERSRKREYGGAELAIDDRTDLFRGIRQKSIKVWMSHGDRVERLPAGFSSIAHSANSPNCAMRGRGGKVFGVQF